MDNANVQRIPLQVSRGCVVASIQVDLSEDVLREFRTDLLQKIHDARTKGVILDVSGLALMDLSEFNALRRIMDMAAVMGAEPILCGLNAGTISSLIDLGADVEDVRATRDLDDAFSALESRLLDEQPDSEGPSSLPDEQTEPRTNDDRFSKTHPDQEFL